MIVFDIVLIVTPGARTSIPAGRWFIASRDQFESAEKEAREYNAHCAIEGMDYVVEVHDEESVERAPTVRQAQ